MPVTAQKRFGWMDLYNSLRTNKNYSQSNNNYNKTYQINIIVVSFQYILFVLSKSYKNRQYDSQNVKPIKQI